MVADANAAFPYGQLVAAAMGMTLLGMLLALLLGGGLHAVLHLAGAWRTRVDAEAKASWWLAVLAVGLCAVMGGWTGLKVGVVRAAVPLAQERGPKLLEEGLQQVLRGAGMTNFPELDVKQLRELVQQVETSPLPPLAFPGVEHLLPQIEAARARLAPAVKALLDAHAKQGKLALNEVVASLWPKMFVELVAWESRFRRWEIITGILWIAGIEASLALGCLALRLTRQPPAPPPTPPKL